MYFEYAIYHNAMDNNLLYKIRFVILNPNVIFNMCGPEHGGPLQWDEEGLALRKKSAEEYIEKMNNRNGFFTRLEESILKQGFRNPVLVNSGFVQPRKFHSLPPEMKNDSKKILFCHSNGGSRLWIAAKHNLEVPCIVSDFIGCFGNEPEIKTEKELLTYYKDDPRGIVFGEYGITIKTLRFSS